MDWSHVDYGDVFISCLDSHSDGTHPLQRIYWWASDVKLNLSKYVPKKKQTIHLGWHWVSAFSANVHFWVNYTFKKHNIRMAWSSRELILKVDYNHNIMLTPHFKYIKENKLAVLVEQSYNLVCFVTLMSCILPTCKLHFPFCLFVFFFLPPLWPYSHFREQTPLTDEQLVAG